MSPVSLAGQKAVVIGFAGYQELHVWYPVLRLRELGAEVTLAGAAGPEAANGSLRYPLLPNAAVADVDADGVALVVVPGGPGAVEAVQSVALTGFLAKAHAAGAAIAAIGEGVTILDAAGVSPEEARVYTAKDTDAIPALFRTFTQEK